MAELSEAARVRRIGDRLGFGLGGDALARAQQAGLAATIRRYLAPVRDDRGAAATPPPTLERLTRPGKKSDGTVDRDARKTWRKAAMAQQQELTLWWLDRMIAADDQLTERLTWFWHGHFATSAQKVKTGALMLQQNQAFRRLGRGEFEALAQSLIIDPAMLVWLDGNDNTVKAPNENLAREFMELFTLGHGHFSEDDVKQAARALTGWKINKQTGAAVLRPQQHDNQPKTILGATADFDAAGFVYQVLKQSASGEFVVRRLWFRLISSTPPTSAELRRLVAAYGSQRNVTAVVAAMVAEPAFGDSASAVVKQPVEWAVGLMRALELRTGDLDEQQQRRLLATLRGMGQVPFRPPSVGGWPAGAGWLTTASALSRMEAARMLGARADLGDAARAPAKQRVEQVRRLLGIDKFSARTTAAITEVADKLPAAIAVGACSPEYTVSA